MESQNINCKKFKKNKDPKCNDQSECFWEKGKGCLPKLMVRTPEEIITDEPILLNKDKPTKKKQQKFLIQNEPNEDALEKFYKLKNEYDTKLNKKKDKIYSNKKLTKREVKQEIKKIKKVCVNCNKDGGTIFSLKNRRLKAVCGAREPCNLNIEIKMGIYVQKKYLIKELKKNILQLKENIIITKLNILFRLENEDVMLEQFNKLKKEFQQQEKQLLELRKFIEEKLNISNKMVTLKNAKDLLQKEINEFNELIKNANIEREKNNISASKVMLKEAVEKQIKEINVLKSTIRNVEYEYTFIDSTNEYFNNIYNIIYLLQEKHTIESTEVEVEPTEVISNKK